MSDIAATLAKRVERLNRYRAATPEEQAAIRAYYRDHPADFIDDWMMTSDPRNADIGLPVTIPFSLFPKQREYVEWVIERWRSREPGLVEKSRDMGLSWLSMAIAVFMWLFYPEVVIGVGSRKEILVDRSGDPDSLFWKARFLIANLPQEFRPAGYVERTHAPNMRITNPQTGAIIRGEAGESIGRGGRASIYFVDEAAHLAEPDQTDAALSQTTNCQIDISTPNGSGNVFYRKRHGGRVPVFTFHWRDDPRKDDAWYAKECARLDPIIVRQEIDLDYAGSVDNAFIVSTLVDDAMSLGPANVESVGFKVLGVDAAHFGNDRSVITFRHGRLVLSQWVYKDPLDGIELAQRVEEIAASYGCDQIVIELDGPGVSCFDQLRAGKYRSKVIGVHTGARRSDGKNYNVKALMWARLREWLNEPPCCLPNDGDLKSELTAMQYSYRDGLMLMERKNEYKKRLGKSPDLADSLALTFAATDATPPQAKQVREQVRQRNYGRSGGSAGWMR